ncbi:hypothetical protein QE152_g22838 [Popillia japonica]|uniref:Uncharacterized protein n=1 Tax=Popillia japonica TaxID=7064 RepID=A0AAW1KJV5_POPJA
MAERPLRNRQPDAIDEDVIAQRVMDKLVANDDYVAKISSKICEQISRLLDENIKGLAEEVSQLRTNIQHINERVEQLEQYSRVNNLRIFGVQVTPNEDTYQTFIDLYKNKLQVDIQSYEHLTRILIKHLLIYIRTNYKWIFSHTISTLFTDFVLKKTVLHPSSCASLEEW